RWRWGWRALPAPAVRRPQREGRRAARLNSRAAGGVGDAAVAAELPEGCRQRRLGASPSAARVRGAC
ncbi:unnamed protein product, partial [Prorocentrum cordatum]